ncbi:MAG: S49 family peptidase [Rubrobacter sp.]|nr:S49 family peptidase [Rubrobacter sp.]
MRYIISPMGLLFTLLTNLARAIRNAAARFRRAPDYVVIDVWGTLPEFERPAGFVRRRLRPGPAPPSLQELRRRFDRIFGDGRLRGIVLRVNNLDAGWAALEELRAEIERYKERGGRVVVYLTEADSRTYYLASAATTVLATPLATVGVTGVRSRVNFLKDALDRVGVAAEVVAVSPYKSAGDTFTRIDFSPEAREQAERLTHNRYEALVEAIAAGRSISLEEARAKIDGAPYPARGAVEAGLLEGMCYEDELAAWLGEDGRRVRIAEWGRAKKVLRMPYREWARRRVGVVSLSGTIVRGKSRRLPVPVPLLGGEQAGSDSVVGALRVAEKNRRVAAVLFHVDSRGGDALASDLIWREVERIREKKPVVVLMGDAAASGGYYVSAAANHIAARRNTITGSIGVISIRPVAAGLYGKLGVNPVAVECGARAGILDPAIRPSADELDVLRYQISSIYDAFKDRVHRGRNLPPRGLENIAGGRVWNGREAFERGLVDEIGGYREALQKARDLAGTGVAREPVMVPPPATRPAPGERAGEISELATAAKEILTTLRDGRAWAVSPFEISED